jgi:hypothetical protein
MSSQNIICPNCNQNLPKSDLHSHNEQCKNNQFKQTFKRAVKDMTNNHETKSKIDDHYYEIGDGMVTFGRASNPNELKHADVSTSQSNTFKKNNSFKKDKNGESSLTQKNNEKIEKSNDNIEELKRSYNMNNEEKYPILLIKEI